MPIGLRHRDKRTNLRLINSFNQVINLLRYALSRVLPQPNFTWHTSLYKKRAHKITGSTNPKGWSSSSFGRATNFSSDTNRTAPKGLSFCYPRLLYCPDQMLAGTWLSQHRVSSSKPSDLVLHVVRDVWGTLLELGLQFVQRRRTRNSLKERDPICAWTNEIAQHQSSNG